MSTEITLEPSNSDENLVSIYEMPMSEVMQIAFELQHRHAIFNRFINSGIPIFDPKEQTAAVYAERATGRYLYMRINPTFWQSKTRTQKAFIIAHECIHLLLDHLIRFTEPNLDPLIVNYAIDLVTNHLLIEKFGFKRSEVNPDNTYCWLDKYFDESENVRSGETAEYYYELLMEKKEKNQLPQSLTVDSHTKLTDEDVAEFIKGMDKILSPDEKETIKDIIKKHVTGDPNAPAGKGSGGLWKFYDFSTVKKKKWETVIKKWSMKVVEVRQRDMQQWIRTNRRMSMVTSDLLIPSEMEIDFDHKEKNKILVYFFLDTSGSCHHLAERFFKAAKSLPEKYFEIRMFCFHDYVVETDITKNKVHLGGGTSFTIIEDQIQKIIRNEKSKYPEAVFIITDGAGTNVAPEFPERWFWFLSADYKHCIPKKSKIFNLKDYE
jgi:hypothetical protein